MAVETLQDYFDIDASNHVPKGLTEVDFGTFDYVIAMDHNIAKQLPDLPEDKVVVWKIDDPQGDDAEQYLECAKSINKEVSKFAGILK